MHGYWFYFLLLFFPALGAAQGSVTSLSGEIIVQLSSKTAIETVLRQKSTLAVGLSSYRLLSKTENIYLLSYLPALQKANTLIPQWQEQRWVIRAQTNATIETRAIPNDPNYSEQWNLDLVQAPAAWEITTGGTTSQGDEIVVAILDTGFKVDHEDLEDNIWINSAETPGNGQDDDDNGYIDDLNGWNFANESPNHASSSHGHRVTAIIGAKGDNGVGISGLNWNIKLLPLTISNEAHAIEAFEYLISLRSAYNESQGSSGAFIVANNNSWGLSNRFCEEDSFWKDLHTRLGEVGILTAGATSNSNINVDETGDIPSTCASEYLITVMNSTESDTKYAQTGYSKVSIDLAAPGENSASLGLQSNFQRFSGTSASAPHVAGAIALLYSLPCDGIAVDALKRPGETALQIRQAILNGVDEIPGLDNFTVTGGRLNVLRAMEELQSNCGNSPAPFTIDKLFPNPANLEINIEFSVPDFDRTYPIRVYNMLGQLIFHDQVEAARFGQISYTLKVEKYSPGAYVIAFGEEEERVHQKVVVY